MISPFLASFDKRNQRKCLDKEREKEKKPYGITLITCNSTLVYIIDYLRGPVSGNFDVKIDVIEIVIIDGDCY